MILELLKKHLPEELYGQVEASLKGVELGTFIPKARFDEVNIAKKAAEDKLLETVTKLDGFKDYDELKAKLETVSDYESIKTEREKLVLETRKNALSKLGIDDSFIDYALGKIDPADFEANATKFATENPKLKAEVFKKIESSLNLSGTPPKNISEMNDQEFVNYRKSFNLDGTPVKK